MARYFRRLVLVTTVLMIFNSAEIQAETASIGYIGSSSSSSSPSDTTSNSKIDTGSIGYIGASSSPGNSSSSSTSPAATSTTSTSTDTSNSSTIEDKNLIAKSNSNTAKQNVSQVIQTTSVGGGGLSINVQGPSVQVQPFSGSANLKIPIAVPPGRAGIQPDLALTYSSSNRKLGNAGVGWTLDLGSIQISTKNGLPKYNGTDIFTLEKDGTTQNLVPDPTISGLYHMEVEGAFASIQFYTTYWVITDKKGTKYYYGNTSDSIQSNPANTTQIFSWALNKVEDLNGNYMTISYFDNGGQIYPQTISYTGNDQQGLAPYAQVSINYGLISQAQIASWYYYNNLIEGKASYLSGFMINTIQRINSINISVGTNLQTTYNLSYTASSDTFRDLLQSITQVGSDGSSTMPPMTFTYQSNAGLTTSTYSLDSSFSNVGYVSPTLTLPQILGDFNGDGKTDVAVYNPSTQAIDVYLSNGTSFGPAQVWFSNLAVTSTQTILVGDFNGDGRADLLIYDSSTGNWQVLLSNGSAFTNNGIWKSSFGIAGPWKDPSGITWSSSIIIPGVADFNGDGISDIYYEQTGCGSICNGNPTIYGAVNSNNTFQLYTNPLNPPNWTPQGSFIFIGDINGDGLGDMLFSSTSGAPYVWFGLTNQGAANNSLNLAQMSYDDGYTYQFSPYAGQNANPIVADFINDGSATQIGYFNQASNVIYYTPLYSGLYPPNTATNPQVYSQSLGSNSLISGTYQIAPADFRGDGITDLVFYDSNHNATVFLSNLQVPDLLVGVNNGIGAQTTITYNSALHYQNTYMPYFMPVVQSTTTTVNSQNYTTNYNYAGGLWDTVYREFDGFQTVTITDPNNNYTTSTYLQDHWLKGHMSEQDTYDSLGNPYTKSMTTWQTQVIATNTTSNQTSKFLYASRTDNYLYDGNSTAMQTSQEFTYGENPQYGDVTQTINDGQVNSQTQLSIDPNKTITSISYVNNTTNWLMGLPSQTTTLDINSNTVSKTSYFYDGDTTGTAAPSLGHLTSKVDWLGSSTQPDPKTTYSYDAYGNLQTTTDPNGNITTITYDNTVHMFPEKTTNALNQNITMTYYGIDSTLLNNNAGLQGLWGQECSKTDANNQTAYTTFDALGRPWASVSPLDTVALPTEQKTYNIQPTYTAITDTARATSGTTSTIQTVSYYDGLGRLIQTKSLGPTAGQYIAAGQTVYDNRGLPITKYLPYFTSNNLNTMDSINTSNPASQMAYDPMGRPITKTNPDNTYSSIAYNQWTTTTTDENGHQQQSIVDAFGRLVQKNEYMGADGRSVYYPAAAFSYTSTYYSYNPRGNLVSVKDAQNNVTTVTYDNLGRKTSMNDPDMGIWNYGYDNNSNLIWQQDAIGNVISFTYDALNRLTKKTDGITGPIINLPGIPLKTATFTVNYNFDDKTQSYGIGRLGSVTYDTGMASFIYDQLGREVSSNKTIQGANYNVARQYDDLNRLQQIQYPDVSQVDYTFNQAGQISGVADAGTQMNGAMMPPMVKGPEARNERLAWLEKLFGVTDAYAGSAPVVSITNPTSGSSFTAGSNVTITATASETGGSIASVAFYYNGTNLLGTGTTSPYTLTVNSIPAGTYTVTAKATDANGISTTSSAITVNILTPPTVSISSPANNATFTVPGSIVINATATAATGTISKVVFYNGATLLGTSISSPYTYTWSSVAAGTYSLTAVATQANTATATSSIVSVTVNPATVAPTITTQPVSVTTTAGMTATFSVVASGTPAPTYQWYNSIGGGAFTIMVGQTSASRTTGILTTADSGNRYECVVTNSAGSVTSNIVTLTVNPATVAPTITSQPMSVTTTAGLTATFSVVATGTPAPTYQWYNSIGGGAFTIMAGQTSASRTTGILTTANSGNRYECVVTNSAGSVTSNIATLTVNPALASEIIDDTTSSKVTITGAWPSSTSVPGYYGTDYLTDGDVLKGTKNVKYTPTLSGPGTYQVYMWYTAASTRATNVPVDIIHSGITTTVTVNQQINGGAWFSLGNYSFLGNASGEGVNIRTTATNNYVIADAVEFTQLTGAPVVAITSPVNGSKSTAGSNITLTATASETNGTISKVAFYNGSTLLSTITTSPYTYIWTSATAGNHSLTAVATDINGVSTTSSPVTVTVNAASEIIDDTTSSKVSITGVWTSSTSTSGYYGTDYLTDGNALKGTKNVKYTPVLAGGAGSYQVYMWYPAAVNRATNVPVDIIHSGITTTVTVNQQINGVAWFSLGTYSFLGNGSGEGVNIRTTSTNGYVIADAVEFTQLSVTPLVSLTSPTNGSSFTAGSNVTLTATASETNGTISKVAFYNGSTLLATVTSSPYTYTWNAVAAGSYNLTAVATDSTGVSATSSIDVITVTGGTLPTITTQPTNQTVNVGQEATFSVVATGAAPLSYQWLQNGVAIFGATGTSYTVPPAASWYNGITYNVIVSNTVGSVTSNTATLIVNPGGPSITTQPANQTVYVGQEATFSVVATGTAPLSYQWYQNGVALTAQTGPTYVVPPAESWYTGLYVQVVVTNSAGSITSNVATLTVNAMPNTYINSVSYNANGQITQIQYGNGTTTAYTYDPLMFRLMRIYTTNTQSVVIQDLNYTYDAIGQVLSITDKVNTSSQTFTYDALNRLMTASGSYGSKTYTYDAIGNVTLKDGLSYNYGEANSRINGTVAGPHAVTSLSDGSVFKYDANGNMVSVQKGSNLTQYVYDTQNRLQSVMTGGLTIASYVYDGDGGRTQKTVTRRDLALYNDNTNPLLFGSTTNPLPATALNPTIDTTNYVGNVYETESGVGRNTKFIYLGNIKVAEEDTSGDLFYFHNDQLGGNNSITDNTGLVREHTEYDPFGQVIVHNKYGNNFATAWYYFTGKPLDDETGSVFFGARYYNPTLGRFITSDDNIPSFSNSQAFNRYSYCYNNPIDLLDQNGHWPIGLVVGTITGGVQGLYTGLYRGGIVGGIIGGVVGGAIGGWVGLYLPDTLATGAITGAIGGTIGNTAGNFINNLTRHTSSSFDNILEPNLAYSIVSGAVFGAAGSSIVGEIAPTLGKNAAQIWSQYITMPLIVGTDAIAYRYDPNGNRINNTILNTVLKPNLPSPTSAVQSSSGGSVSSPGHNVVNLHVITTGNWGGWSIGSNFGDVYAGYSLGGTTSGGSSVGSSYNYGGSGYGGGGTVGSGYQGNGSGGSVSGGSGSQGYGYGFLEQYYGPGGYGTGVDVSSGNDGGQGGGGFYSGGTSNISVTGGIVGSGDMPEAGWYG